MLSNGGKPAIGTDSNMLGVRVPPHPNPDITPTADGSVSPGTHGMSVAPTWQELPYFLIPKRLKTKAPGAKGRNDLVCFRMGNGAFRTEAINEHLTMNADSATHGTVQPAHAMSIDDFQLRLAETQNEWVVDEE
jgi:hypothetical protein